MEAAEPRKIKQHDGLSININAPCTNHIIANGGIEVNVYLPTESPERAADAADIGIRIARSMQAEELQSDLT